MPVRRRIAALVRARLEALARHREAIRRAVVAGMLPQGTLAAGRAIWTTCDLIWQAADGRTPLSEIVERRVCQEFDVEPEVAWQDAEQFVTELSQHGILLVSDQPIPEPELGTAEAR